MAVKKKLSKNDLIRMINDIIGQEAFTKLDNLPDAEINRFLKWLRKGKVSLHTDGYLGFTVDTAHGWTSECFNKMGIK